MSKSGCEKYIEMLEEYTDGFLDEAGEKELHAHLESCSGCRAEFEAQQALVQSMESLEVIDPGDRFTSMVMQRITRRYAEGRPGVFGKLSGAVGKYITLHRRLAWATLVLVGMSSSVVIPYMLRAGTPGFISTFTDALSFLMSPLPGIITFINRAVDLSAPILRTLYLVIKVCADFLLAIICTSQFSFVLIASVLVVTTASVWTFLHFTLSQRRIYHANRYL
jgi:hypothetical protein